MDSAEKRGNMRSTDKRLGLVLKIAAAVGILLVAVYLAGLIFFKFHFLPGTVINGVDASYSNINNLKEDFQEYKLTVQQLQTDGGIQEEEIAGRSISLELENQTRLKEILRSQRYWLWFLPKENIYEGLEIVAFDEEALEEAVDGLKGFQEDFVQEPQDAGISDYNEEEGYTVVPEVPGNLLDRDKTIEGIRRAVLTMQETISLEEADCYQKPAVTSEDEELQTELATLNKYTSTKLTYRFGEKQEVLDGSTISQWLSVKNGKVKIDKKEVENYVAGLRRKYDTIFGTREFQTSYGKKVTIVGGDYGWWMNSAEETKQLIRLIKKGKVGRRKPVYYQTAASYGTPDYGDTYVEINLTAQHLFLYKDGKKILESDFVSGNPTYGNATPDGVYGITYKERNATLDGENYSTPVSYWMPFNQNIGMHDATWRSSFGGSIYKTNGSHGCINLPYSVAQKIYKIIEQGTPVICYELPGTESSSSDSVSGSASQSQTDNSSRQKKQKKKNASQ